MTIDANDFPVLSGLLREHFERGAESTEMLAEARLLIDSESHANAQLAGEVAGIRKWISGDKTRRESVVVELVRQIRGDEPASTNSQKNVHDSTQTKSMPSDYDCPGLAGHVRLLLSTDNYWPPDAVEAQLAKWMKNPPSEYRIELGQLVGEDDADTQLRIARFVARSKGVPIDLHERRQVKLDPISAFVPFPLDALPQPISGAVLAYATAIGCDPAAVALPMLAALAGAVGNARRIRLKTTWTEPMIVWAVIVAPSGAVKSPPLDAALAWLRATQNLAFKKHADDMAKYKVAIERHQAQLSDWKKKSSRGDPPVEPAEPIMWRIVVVDATVEAIAPILRDNARGLLLARDELSGWFRGFDQYKGGRGGDVAHWLEWFRGAPSTIDRKGGDEKVIHIQNASVSVTGTVQPEMLRDALGFEHFADGLAARLLLAMPPQKPRVWTEAVVAPEIEAQVARIFGRLLSLMPTDGEPVLVDLSPTGKRAWVDFFNRHGHEQAALSGDLAAAWSKLEGYCARFALLIHLLRMAADDRASTDSEVFVDKEDIEAAARLVDWFGREAERVYRVLSEPPEDAQARALVELIGRRGGSITARDLRRASRRYATTEAADAALADLVRAGLGQFFDVTHDGGPGRTTRAFRLRECVDDADVDEIPRNSSTATATGSAADGVVDLDVEPGAAS
jgi:hypothetical protein